MHRTEGANNINGLFTAGPPPSTVTPEWLNSIQEELATVIETYGDPLQSAATDTHDQLLSAITNVLQQYDYIVTTQTGFESIIERTGANAYKFNDAYKSVLFKVNDYAISGILDGGDTWGTIKTNNVSNLVFEAGASLHFGDLAGHLEINTAYAKLTNVCIKGTGAVTSTATNSFYINASYVTMDSCTTHTRKSSGTLNCFEVNGTVPKYTSKFINCMAHTITSFIGFYKCSNISNCTVYNCTTGKGYRDCQNISSSMVYSCSNVLSFYGCYNISSCRIDTITDLTSGCFLQCYNISACYIYNVASSAASSIYIFSACYSISSCYINKIDTTGAGDSRLFVSSENITGCKAYDIDIESTGNMTGFYTCSNISGCSINAMNGGTSKGFYTCAQISGCIISNLTSSSGNAVTGFSNCTQVTGCSVYTITGTGGAGGETQGFAVCQVVSGCYVFDANSAGTCTAFYTCNRISSCYANDIYSSGAATVAMGFYSCMFLSSCDAQGISAPTGSQYGYNACQYGSSLFTDCATNASNDWIDSTDAQITHKVSCPDVFT